MSPVGVRAIERKKVMPPFPDQLRNWGRAKFKKKGLAAAEMEAKGFKSLEVLG